MFRVKNVRKDGGLIQPMKNSMAKCHPDKPLQARGLCKACYNQWLLQNNPEYARKQRENTLSWIKKNKEKRRKYEKDWRAKQDPEYIRQYRRMKILERYGMTHADYDKLLRKQNGVCAICEEYPKKGKNLHIDHDHKTGFVRGLLCFRCNFGLSYFDKGQSIIENLHRYICRK